MSKVIKRYCKKCIPTCERIKTRTTRRRGTNFPLPTPSQPWEYISMDYITNLPEVNGNNAIVTFVDTFTKQAHFIPCSNIKINAQQLAKIYIREVYRLHGLSRVIICDLDPRSTSSFGEICSVNYKLSSISPRHIIPKPMDKRNGLIAPLNKSYKPSYINNTPNGMTSCPLNNFRTIILAIYLPPSLHSKLFMDSILLLPLP